MTIGRAILGICCVVVLAYAGYLIFGSGGVWMGLAALIPGLKALLASKKHAGAVEQHQAQTATAAAAKAKLQEQHREIDRLTEEQVATIRREATSRLGRTPTQAEVDAMAQKFGGRR